MRLTSMCLNGCTFSRSTRGIFWILHCRLSSICSTSFFASAAHSISSVLPKRMEFRPMIEMTPDQLEKQVDLELEDEDDEGEVETDFSKRLIHKMEKDGRNKEEPDVAADPLSVFSLISQGFEDAEARRALRMHNNDTQAALDWLMHGRYEQKAVSEDAVRMPTTVRRIQKMKEKRWAWLQKEIKEQEEREAAEARERRAAAADADSDDSEERKKAKKEKKKEKKEKKKEKKEKKSKKDREGDDEEGGDLLDLADSSQAAPAPAQSQEADLLGDMDDTPPAASDFSQVSALPDLHGSFDPTQCKRFENNVETTAPASSVATSAMSALDELADLGTSSQTGSVTGAMAGTPSLGLEGLDGIAGGSPPAAAPPAPVSTETTTDFLAELAPSDADAGNPAL
mmetsp:Transcript_33232/g.86104  ORF Transcript_33232/g.86104 Transcript_33232/m.86104 type:complete len:398 (+) Transcript_33232:602-1795(+)